MKPSPKSIVYAVLLVALLLVVASAFRWFSVEESVPSTKIATTQSSDTSVKIELTNDFGYIGMNRCRVCHSDITRSYRKTAMGRSFAAVADEKEVREDFYKNNDHYWEVRDRYYQMTDEDGDLFMTSYSLDGDGNRVREHKDQITHWLGSGENMRGAVSLRGNTYYLLHMSWYGPRDEWAPFAMREFGGAPEQPLGFNCLFCHAGYPRNALDARWVSEVDLFSEPLELSSVDCERCHGAGLNHAQLAYEDADAEVIRKAIVNPGRLSPDRQIDVCAQCHLEPTTRIRFHRLVQPGRPPFGFRPGERLEDHFLIFDFADHDGHHEEDTEIVNQVYLMRQSPCYQKSEGRMTCTTCHDPHRTPPKPERDAYFRAKCLTCHAVADCASPACDAQSVQTSNCVECHMARTHPVDAQRVVVRRHKIERYPLSNVDSPLANRLAHSQRMYASKGSDIKLYHDHVNLSEEQKELFLSIGRVRNGLTEFPSMDLEQGMADFGITDPVTHRILGVLQLKRGELDQARAAFRRALEHLPAYYPAKTELARIEMQQNNPQRALALYQEVLDQVPMDLIARKGVVEAYRKLGDQQQARQSFDEWQKVLERNIDTEQATPLGFLLMQAGRMNEANVFFRQALRINADDAAAQMGLNMLNRARSGG